MLETQEKLIGNYRYRVTTLPASKGRKLLVKLTTVLGPVLGSFLEDMPGLADARAKGVDFSLWNLDGALFSNALQQLAARLRTEDLEEVCATLGGHTVLVQPDGKEFELTAECQELHFAGRYGEMFRWLGFALEVNFADFFAALPTSEALRVVGTQEKQSPSTSPKGSPGMSGESSAPSTSQ